MLLTDSLGQTVKAIRDSVYGRLRPTTALGLKYQTPSTHKGVGLNPAVWDKLESMQAGLPDFEFFPAAPPRLMPYLYNEDEFGNAAARPGALFGDLPLIPWVQESKYLWSSAGLRYSLAQTFTYAGMSDVEQGDSNLGNYNLNFKAKWAVFDARSAGTAGWISTQIEYQAPLGSGQGQTLNSNIGSLTKPNGFWSSHEGVRVPELAWQESLLAGQVVVVAGMVNQANYIDANAYADSGRGQFINSALINSMVLPLPGYGYGVNLQWQPRNDWYTLLGYSVGSSSSSEDPRMNFSWEKWSLEWEIGYAPDDFLGLGPGIYRIQPFIARTGEAVQGGLAFNVQQQLGHQSPFGWFGRLGFGGSEASGAAKAQVGTGFVMQAPLKYVGWVPRLTNDLVGVGFVWSQPSATTKTVYHNNEYVLETFYTLQLTPTSRLQPDLQIVWNPAFNPDPGPAVVFQFQFIVQW